MFTILPSRDPSTVAIEMEGKMTETDAKNLEDHVSENFGDNDPFNLFAIIHDVEGTSFNGLKEGMKFDTKRWKQVRKYAVISESSWIRNSAKAGKLLPGIDIKQFEPSEQEAAWDWIKD
ncbi:STAS/SEC14 domain-containing protein [Bacillus piscicola]|uniref:STAS/SEC14 domain-containing protein n=1 Tax=Bacillus piscicola TaxID=1632684 RepID=UPI001F097EA8|nr:STAS/SEC14 domain-containing protein [Bacillus piscicola]